jgi:hypothetical protein
VSGLVVGWDGNIDELEGSVGVGEGDNSGLGQQLFRAVLLFPCAPSDSSPNIPRCALSRPPFGPLSMCEAALTGC